MLGRKNENLSGFRFARYRAQKKINKKGKEKEDGA
jgi:hypothetical protein